jgi:hypothetical protein
MGVEIATATPSRGARSTDGDRDRRRAGAALCHDTGVRMRAGGAITP